jgi:hypothetical protein
MTEQPDKPTELPPQDEATLQQKPPHRLVYRAGDHERSVLKFIQHVLVQHHPNEMMLVLGDLKARRKEGIKKYGIELQTNNGRDALVDGYQELLDAVMYLTQASMEVAGVSEAAPHFQSLVSMTLQAAAQASLILRIRKGEIKFVEQPPAEAAEATAASAAASEPQPASHPEAAETPASSTPASAE